MWLACRQQVKNDDKWHASRQRDEDDGIVRHHNDEKWREITRVKAIGGKLMKPPQQNKGGNSCRHHNVETWR